MRTVYTDTLIELAESDPNIVVLEADLITSGPMEPVKPVEVQPPEDGVDRGRSDV